MVGPILADARLLEVLRCPVCRAEVTPVLDGERLLALRCVAGHRFDSARQGYVNFGVGTTRAHGDDGAQVAARQRFLASGHFSPIADAVAGAARAASCSEPALPLLEVGAGTGYYLSHALGSLPGQLGIAMDVSPYALRRAARAHERVAAIGADVWHTWPIADARLSAVLCVFGPRNQDEFARVLAPGGVLVVATPGPAHLAELIGPLGMIGVDPAKDERLAAQLAAFDQIARRDVAGTLRLERQAVSDLAAMGPSARHITPTDLAARISTLSEPIDVSVDVTVRTYRLA